MFEFEIPESKQVPLGLKFNPENLLSQGILEESLAECVSQNQSGFPHLFLSTHLNSRNCPPSTGMIETTRG